ncbi:MAG: outer membrane lipoprotein-sorting protein [Planctomycetota bacterium]|jgi:outer membrane lipoprotein-sorting protein
MRNSIVIALGTFIAVLPAATALAQPTGREIVEKFDNSNRAEDETVEVEMVLISSSGRKRTRSLTMWAKSGATPADDLSLIRFHSPPIMRDTGFLTIEEEGHNKQWIFIPDLRRSKRIAGSSRAGAFVESDLRNYDVATESPSEHNYKLTGEQELQGRPCYKILAKPKDEDVLDMCGYQKRIMYIDKERFTLVRTEYFDKAGKPLKVATNSDWTKMKGRWRFNKLTVENSQEGSKTIMRFKANTRQMDQGLSDSHFSKRKLEKP